MAIVGFAHLGDKTDHGGVIVTSADPTSTDQGMPFACVGDKATCPRHSGLQTIITSRFPTMTLERHPIAFDGDLLTCGARIISSTNGVSGWGDAPATQSADARAGEYNPEAATPEIEPTPAAAAIVPTRFREYFVLMDQEGQRIPGLPYSLGLQNGESLDGQTDEQGRTGVVWTAKSESISVTAEARPKVDDPYHYGVPDENYPDL